MQANHLQKANQHISAAAQLHDFSPRMQLRMCVSICLRCRVTKLPSMLFFIVLFPSSSNQLPQAETLVRGLYTP